MQENTQWYELTQALSYPSLTKPGTGLSRRLQRGTARLQLWSHRWHCAVELFAVNLVSKLPSSLGTPLRSLFYAVFFAHTGKGLHVRASYTQASQPFSKARNQFNSDPGKARSLYENCLRGGLKGDG